MKFKGISDKGFSRIAKSVKAVEQRWEEEAALKDFMENIWINYDDNDSEEEGREAFEESYRGTYDSLSDYVYEFIQEIGGVGQLDPKTIQMYFDWEAFARDMELNSEVEFIDGHVFDMGWLHS